MCHHDFNIWAREEDGTRGQRATAVYKRASGIQFWFYVNAIDLTGTLQSKYLCRLFLPSSYLQSSQTLSAAYALFCLLPPLPPILYLYDLTLYHKGGAFSWKHSSSYILALMSDNIALDFLWLRISGIKGVLWFSTFKSIRHTWKIMHTSCW